MVLISCSLAESLNELFCDWKHGLHLLLHYRFHLQCDSKHAAFHSSVYICLFMTNYSSFWQNLSKSFLSGCIWKCWKPLFAYSTEMFPKPPFFFFWTVPSCVNMLAFNYGMYSLEKSTVLKGDVSTHAGFYPTGQCGAWISSSCERCSSVNYIYT